MSLQKYRDDLIAKYRLAGQPSGASLAAWHNVNRDALDKMGGLNELQGPLIAKLVDTFEQDHELIAGYGALNRWPARTGVPVEEYLRLWKQSCLEIRTTERLPSAIELMLYND